MEMMNYFIVLYPIITTCGGILFGQKYSWEEDDSHEKRNVPPPAEYPPPEEEDPDKRPDICLLREEPGICPHSEQIEQWYYNTSMGACTTFMYNGCDGNDNRFSTCSECRQECKSDVCATPRDEIDKTTHTSKRP
ncbi:hypothetical protein MTO96_041565 [Rhipicephalus appendiculatus]